jgi:hypothetical protein
MATVRNIFTNFVVKFMIDFIATVDVEKITEYSEKEYINMPFH